MARVDRRSCMLLPGLLAVACLLQAAGSAAAIDAAKNGNRALLDSLIRQKADIDKPDVDGSTPLHWAAYRDDVTIAELLIHGGAKINAQTDLGATPLWLAAQNGGSAMVRTLLAAGANPNFALLSGETPLMVAARGGYAAVMEQLIAKGANLNVRGTRGQTALMWAVAQKHPEAVKVLLAHHADIHLRSEQWTEVMAVPPHGYLPYNKAIPHGNETALLFAARAGDLESAKLLVSAGADVNDADAWGVSATTLAAHSGFTGLVQFLLDKGADPNAAPNGFTALHEPVMRRDKRMVQGLLEHHADPNAPLRTWTPTRRSSEDFHFEPSMVGATPFWMAARYLEPDIMRLLAEHGADPKFVLHAKWTASVGTGAVDKAENSTPLLAALGLSGDGGGRDAGGAGGFGGWVPWPAGPRELLALETVKLAVQLGIDVNATTIDGRTALDGAKSLRYASVVSFLQEKGAKPGTGGTRSGGGRGRANAPAAVEPN
jgi:uncharacterized protein